MIEVVKKLPGVGPKMAERLCYHILKMSDVEAKSFVEAIQNARQKVKVCSICYNLSESEEVITKLLKESLAYEENVENFTILGSYIYDKVQEIKKELFSLDANGESTLGIKFISAEQITKYINDLYNSTEDAASALVNRCDLASAVMKGLSDLSEIDKSLNKNIVDKFGYDLSNYTTSQLRTFILEDIQMKAEAEIGAKLTEVNQYVPIAKYFFDGWSAEAASKYAKLVDKISEKLGTSYSKPQIIDMISEYDTKVSDDRKVSYLMSDATTDTEITSVATLFTGAGRTINYTESTPLIQNTGRVYDILKGRDASVASVTEAQWLMSLGTMTAYDLAVKYNPGLAVVTGSQWVESLKTVTAYSLACKSEYEMTEGEKAWLDTFRTASVTTTTAVPHIPTAQQAAPSAHERWPRTPVRAPPQTPWPG